MKDGFTRARILEGGINGWKAAGFPIEKKNPGLENSSGSDAWAILFPHCLCPEEDHGPHVEELEGRLDYSVAGELQKRIRVLLHKGARVTLSLGAVTYLDTAIIGVLVEASRWARDQGACLSLANVSDAAAGALQVARLQDFFPADLK